MSLIDEVRAAHRLPPPAEAKAIRMRARVPVSRLARELKVHRVSVARWEAGKRTPRGDLLRAYVELLDELNEAVSA